MYKRVYYNTQAFYFHIIMLECRRARYEYARYFVRTGGFNEAARDRLYSHIIAKQFGR